jgi:4-hydroxy-3-polyprenylbenzoate decarboxylase
MGVGQDAGRTMSADDGLGGADERDSRRAAGDASNDAHRHPGSAANDRAGSAEDGQSRKPRIVVGISGASGAIYGIRLLQMLRRLNIETHLVMSRSALLTLSLETSMSAADVRALSDFSYPNTDIGAAISSGSFRTIGMIVAPCSIKTLSEVATGVTNSLLSRAADVMLKERRRLVLLVRETPLHLGHLRSMAAVTEAGAVVYPPVPAFYAKPQSLDEMVEHTLGRVLDLFDVDSKTVHRWGE